MFREEIIDILNKSKPLRWDKVLFAKWKNM